MLFLLLIVLNRLYEGHITCCHPNAEGRWHLESFQQALPNTLPFG